MDYSHYHYSRGLYVIWFWFVFGIAGTLFPDLLAGQFLDEPRIVRWIAVPMLIATSIYLSDYYFSWSKGLF